MVYALIRKKHILLIVFIFAVSVLFSACDPYVDSYPFLTEGKWECSDPVIVLEYAKSDAGVITEHCAMEWNDMLLYINLNFQAGSFVVNPATSNHYDKRLFTGSWEYRDGNLVLIIEEDFLLDHTYDELVFVKANKAD